MHSKVMLKDAEIRWVYQHAYLPEHLPDYVGAISGARPHLLAPFLCYVRRRHLVFVGYPLNAADQDAGAAYDMACSRFNPASISIIAPDTWFAENAVQTASADDYYRLDLPLRHVDSEVAYMVRRALREVVVSPGSFDREHRRLVKEFLAERSMGQNQQYIFRHMGDYLKRSSSARLIDARKNKRLAGFTVFDLGSANFAYYLFNIRSKKLSVPGVADVLFRQMVDSAQQEGKKTLNLGLGINAGIRRFKEKWGGKVFLPYRSVLIEKEAAGLDNLANKL